MFGLGQKPKPSSVAEKDTSPVRKLVSQLMAEPFAESQHLEEATLDQLGRTLEEATTDYERADLPPSLHDAAGSFLRCKDLYCQILLDLESLAVGDWENKTLAELANPPAGTPEVAATPVPPGAPGELPNDMPVEMPDLPFNEPSHAFDIPAMELPTIPHMDIVAAPPMETVPEVLAEPAPAPAPVFEPEPIAAAEPAVELEPEAEAASEPEPEEPTLITDLAKLTAEASALIPPTPEPLPIVQRSESPATFAMPKMVKLDLGFGQRAKELQLISEWLRTLAPKEPSSVDSPQINRLATQLLGAAMEIECWERMREGTQKVWEKRESAIKRIFDAKKSPWCLPQATKDQMAQLEKSLVKNGAGGTKPLPYFAIENSLRYLMTLPKFDHFRLSLLDAGTYLFFFGQKRELREYQLENHYWTQEAKLAETAEAALRLIRFHELHKRSLTPWSDSDGGVSQTAEQAEASAEKILALFDTAGLRRGR